jgi:hypothetical protein
MTFKHVMNGENDAGARRRDILSSGKVSVLERLACGM